MERFVIANQIESFEQLQEFKIQREPAYEKLSVERQQLVEQIARLEQFDYWHVVLNDGELIFPYNENVVYSKEERQESWENIFDYECSFDSEERTIGLSTQATMWEIKAEWVLKVEHFKTR